MMDVATRRGAYAAERASALAGLPRRTLYEWAERGLVLPSISPEKVKLWSWTDLVTLRAAYWLRHPGATTGRRATTLALVARTLKEIRRSLGDPGAALWRGDLILAVDPAGVPHIEVQGILREGTHDYRQGVLRATVVSLLDEFPVEDELIGPSLVQPRPLVRIIPGKLSGEPHIAGTRVETVVLRALERRGFEPEALAGLYPDLSRESIAQALELEKQLELNVRRAA